MAENKSKLIIEDYKSDFKFEFLSIKSLINLFPFWMSEFFIRYKAFLRTIKSLVLSE